MSKANQLSSDVFQVPVESRAIPEHKIPPAPKKNKGVLYPGQNWIELTGRFNPDELRALADQVDKANEGVPPRVVS